MSYPDVVAPKIIPSEPEQLAPPTPKVLVKTSKDIAEDLLSYIKKGKEIHDVFAENFKNRYTMNGKTIAQWDKYFRITVPPDPDPSTCQRLDMELMGLHQEASFFHASACIYTQALESSSTSEFSNRITRLVAEYKSSNKKLPAKDTLENLVKAETDDIGSALANAVLQKEYWSNILKHINGCRGYIENATMNSGIQAKLNRSQVT